VSVSVPFLPETAIGDLTDREFADRLKAFLAGTLTDLRLQQEAAPYRGREGCGRYADAMDAVLRALHDRARVKFLAASSDLNYRLAAVAVGGYGRRELCPKSDIDILFLYPYKIDPYVEAMTESILYPLWDLGLDVGHSVRSVKETIRMAAADDSIRTALLDFRLVVGDEPFFREAEEELIRYLYFSGADRFIEKKIGEMRARHARHGGTVFLLEPNVKEGKGGLRDLHTAIWAARIKFKCASLVELRNKGVVGSQTTRAFQHVHDYLLRVRCALHFLRGKKTDVLSFEVQEPLAHALGYRTHGKNFAMERFMRSYYMHARSAVNIAEEILEEVDRLMPEPSRKPFAFLRRKTVSGEGILYKGRIHVRDRASFQKDPVRILDVFRMLQRTRSELSAQAKRSIQSALPAVGAAFREDRRAAALFLEILADPCHMRETLLAMHDCRFLGRYIPEFGPLSCKALHDIYHVYTVDIHSILAASVPAQTETAPARTTEEERFLEIYRSLPRPELLNLAILLHDVGKGKGHGHSEVGAGLVERIGARLGLSPEEIGDLVFLVRNHLLMAHVSQRRDMHDIELILWFAEAVGTLPRLDQLYLLTYADLRAVGPDVWTQWKGMLLAELYGKTRNILAHGPLKRPFEEQARQRRGEVRDLLSGFPAEEAGRFLDRFDDRYFLATPDARFADHLRFLTAFDGRTPLVEVIDSPASGASEVVIVCPDQRGLFAKIAGTLSANMVNILNASINTSRDGVALDTFYVTYMGRSLEGEPKKERVTADLIAVLGGEADVEALIAERKGIRFVREKVVARYRPTRVVFDNSVSSRYTVIDVFTYDRIGLLYDITRTLSALGIDIVLSKISTKADQVADVFYITDRDGMKVVLPERQEEIRASLLAAINP
jgi:[protein-PII] uridylyltransferase